MSGWSDEENAELVRLWNQGLSGAQIAEHLPERSRNAVIGHAHRLGLASRPSPIRGSAKSSPNPNIHRVRHAKPGKVAKFNQPGKKSIPVPHGIFGRAAGPIVADTLIFQAETPPEPEFIPKPRPHQHRFSPSREKECQYPLGERLNWSKCGAPAAPGLPYCEKHATLCYRQAPSG